MNTYTAHTTNKCPNNGKTDSYEIQIQTAHTIMVESIIEILEKAPTPIFQEDLTAYIRTETGASVKVIGEHQGVKIESRSGTWL